MIHTNQLYLVTDKTVEKIWNMAEHAVDNLNLMADRPDKQAGIDAAAALCFDIQELLEDITPVPGIEGLDRIGHKPAFPVK